MDASRLQTIAKQAALRATQLDAAGLVPGTAQALQAATLYQTAAVALGTLVFSAIDVAGSEAMHSHAFSYAERAIRLGFSVEEHAARTGTSCERFRLHPTLQREVDAHIRSSSATTPASSAASAGPRQSAVSSGTSSDSLSGPGPSTPTMDLHQYIVEMTQSAIDMERAGNADGARSTMSEAATLAINALKSHPTDPRFQELAVMLVGQVEALSEAASGDSAASATRAERPTATNGGISPDGAARAASEAIAEASQLRQRFRTQHALMAFTRALELCVVALEAGPARCSMYGISVTAAMTALNASSELRSKLASGSGASGELRKAIVAARQAELKCITAGGTTLTIAIENGKYEQVAAVRAAEPHATAQVGYPFASSARPVVASAKPVIHPSTVPLPYIAMLKQKEEAEARLRAEALATARAEAQARADAAVAHAAASLSQARAKERSEILAQLQASRMRTSSRSSPVSGSAIAVAPPSPSPSASYPTGTTSPGGEDSTTGATSSTDGGGVPSSYRAKLAEAEASRLAEKDASDDRQSDDFEL